jgi:hypothetical protein
MNREFEARSPKTGDMRTWEAVMGIGNQNPSEIITIDNGPTEAFSPGSPEYNELLEIFHRT